MMTKPAITRTVLAGAMLFSAVVRADLTTDQHATICQAEDSTQDSFLAHTVWGIHNTTDTDSATVWCPVQVTRETGAFAAENFYTSVHIYQRNANIPFTCTFYQLEIDGTPHWWWTMSATDPSLSFAGGFVLDVNQPDGWPYVNVWRCTIPPETEDGRFSHVTSLNISWVRPQ